MALEIRKMKDKKEFALINLNFTQLKTIKDSLASLKKQNPVAEQLWQEIETQMENIAI